MTLITIPVEVPAQTPRRLAIVVTQEHLERGEPEDSESCAIALAIRALGYGDVSVTSSTVAIWLNPERGNPDDLYELWMPGPMIAWVRAFDAGEPVHPERFVLDVPADWPEPAAVSRAS